MKREIAAAPHALEALARWLLLALVVLPFAVYVPRVLAAGDSLPSRPPARWAHLVVLTAETFVGKPDLELAPLARLEARSTHADRTLSPSLVPAAAAASFWTGRWPHNHGILGPDRGLSPTAWTLASALRESGARTFAFLAGPFVTATGIGGFEEVWEDPGADRTALVERAVAALRNAPDERFVLWVHLPDAGPGGAELVRALADLQTELERDGRRADCATLVFTLAGDPQAKGEARFAVPFWLELQTALFYGRRAPGEIMLLDLVRPLIGLFGVRGPDALAGQAPLQSRGGSESALAGAPLRSWHVLHEPGSHRWIDGPLRISAPDPPPAPSEALVWAHPRGEDALGPEARAAGERRYRAAFQALLEGAETGVPARVPAAWSGRSGW